MCASIVWAAFFLVIIYWFLDDIKKIFCALQSKGKFQYRNFVLTLGEQGSISNQEDNSQTFQYSRTFQSPIITNEEKIIKEQLQPTSKEEAIAILIYQLANKNLAEKLWIINNFIYNEQIEILSFANSLNKHFQKNDTNKYYEKWKSNNSGANYTFEQFFSFLINQGLINETLSGCAITILGKEFLAFRIKAGYPINFYSIQN